MTRQIIFLTIQQTAVPKIIFPDGLDKMRLQEFIPPLKIIVSSQILRGFFSTHKYFQLGRVNANIFGWAGIYAQFQYQDVVNLVCLHPDYLGVVSEKLGFWISLMLYICSS